MSITLVTSSVGENVGDNGNAAAPQTNPGVPAIGDLVIVVASRWASASDPFVVGDISTTQGSTGAWSLDKTYTLQIDSSNYQHVAIFSALITGVSVVTASVAQGAGQYISARIALFHATAGWDANRLYGTNQNGSATAGTAADSGNLTGAGLFIGGLAINGDSSDSITKDAAFSLIGQTTDGSAHEEGSGIYQIASGSITDSASWTITSNPWAAIVCRYNEVGAEGASGSVQGLIAGVCSTAAQLLGAGALAGLIAGSAVANAAFPPSGAIAGTIAGTSTASAYFPATQVALGGTVNCVSTVDAKIQAQTGAIFPRAATTSSEDPWMDNDWLSAAYVSSDGAGTANITAASFDAPDQSYVLKAYNYDFSGIPDAASILGVSAAVNAWWRTGQGGTQMDLLQLLNTTGGKVGTNQCSTPVGMVTATGTVISKGGATDTWGNALDAAWVKNSSFGLAIGVSATAANADVDVDYATLEVFYSPPVYAYRSASSIGIGSASGYVWGQGDILGFSPGLAAIWAEVYAIGKLQGAIAGSPTITADLTGSAPGVLAGAIAGTSTASAQQSATGALGVTTTGGFTYVVAGGGVTYAMAGAIAGAGTANAQAKGTGNIQTASIGLGTGAAQISGSGKLEGYAPGTGAQTAQITAVLPGDIRAYVPGSGTANAIIIYSGGCLGTISGTSSVGANLAQLDPASAIRRRIWLGYIFSPTPAPGGTSAQDRYEWLALPYENATAAYAAGTCTVNAQLTGIGSGAVAGAIAGTSTGNAQIFGTGNIAIAIAGLSTANSQIFGTGNIAAAVAGTSTCAAAVSASTGCQGASIGVATATAGLVGTGNIQVAVAGTGAASSLLGGTFPIQAASAGLGTVNGYLVSSVAIQAASIGTGAANAQITATGRLQSASIGVATVTAGPTATGALAATSTGVGTLNAQIVGTGAIRGAAAGLGSNTAAITGLAPGQAMGAIAGVGTANANLKGTGAMRAYAAGVGTCSQKPGAAAAAHFGGFGTLFQLHTRKQRIFG